MHKSSELGGESRGAKSLRPDLGGEIQGGKFPSTARLGGAKAENDVLELFLSFCAPQAKIFSPPELFYT